MPLLPLAVSDIPFDGPISEVRVARIGGEFVINPTYEQLEEADIDMMIAGSMDSIVMVEGEMHEMSEQEMVSAIEAAHAAIKVQCQVQLDMAFEVRFFSQARYSMKHDDSLKQAIHDACYRAYYDAAKNAGSKKERGATFKAIKEDFLASMSDEDKAAKSTCSATTSRRPRRRPSAICSSMRASP